MFTATQQYSVTPTTPSSASVGQRRMLLLPERASSFLRDVTRRSLRVARPKASAVIATSDAEGVAAKKRKSDSFLPLAEGTPVCAGSGAWSRVTPTSELHIGIVAPVDADLTAWMRASDGNGNGGAKEIVVDGETVTVALRSHRDMQPSQFAWWLDAVVVLAAGAGATATTTAPDCAGLGLCDAVSRLRSLQDVPVVVVGSRGSSCVAALLDAVRQLKARLGLRQCALFRAAAPIADRDVAFLLNEACAMAMRGRRRRLPRLLPLLPAANDHATPNIRETYSNLRFDSACPPSSSSLSSSCKPPPEDKENRPTPSSLFTPTLARREARRSRRYSSVRASSSSVASRQSVAAASAVGSGRAIPIRQGYLLKRSSKGFSSKEWKKKYVTLTDDFRMTYHANIHDYMENVNGKEIHLAYVTVKVPGQRPRGSRTVLSSAEQSLSASRASSACHPHAHHDDFATPTLASAETPTSTKRRPFRLDAAVDLYEFQLVSLHNQQWLFEATCAEERDEWIEAIEQQIFNSLQNNAIVKTRLASAGAPFSSDVVRRLRTDVAGNDKCVDCDAPNPDWASLNLGVLMCIACSGVHRQLGSHISRVRSLDLDEWPKHHLAVMTAVGNTMANQVWQANLRTKREEEADDDRVATPKTSADAANEDRERFIFDKYKDKKFLADNSDTNHKEALADAIKSCDMKSLLTCLSRLDPSDVNYVTDVQEGTTPMHLAAASGNLAIAQLLIWCNGDVSCLDAHGRSAAWYAAESGNADVVELLASHGCSIKTESEASTVIQEEEEIQRTPQKEEHDNELKAR